MEPVKPSAAQANQPNKDQWVAILEERQQIARELHDTVTQTLFSASLIAEVLPQLWDLDPQEGKARLDELCQLTSNALADLRSLMALWHAAWPTSAANGSQ